MVFFFSSGDIRAILFSSRVAFRFSNYSMFLLASACCAASFKSASVSASFAVKVSF